jgi:hypothetical protein
LAKHFQRRFFGNRPIRKNNCLWWPCLLTDRNSMSILYRGPSIWPPQQFFFLIGRFLKNILLWNRLSKWTEPW